MDRLIRLFDDLFNQSWEYCIEGMNSSTFYDEVHFPLTNVFLYKNKDLEFTMAIAGYNKDDISIEFDGDYMTVSLKNSSNKSRTEEGTWLKRSIKIARGKARYYVPSSKYDQLKASAEMKDGLLKIRIPSKEKTEILQLEIK